MSSWPVAQSECAGKCRGENGPTSRRWVGVTSPGPALRRCSFATCVSWRGANGPRGALGGAVRARHDGPPRGIRERIRGSRSARAEWLRVCPARTKRIDLTGFLNNGGQREFVWRPAAREGTWRARGRVGLAGAQLVFETHDVLGSAAVPGCRKRACYKWCVRPREPPRHPPPSRSES